MVSGDKLIKSSSFSNKFYLLGFEGYQVSAIFFSLGSLSANVMTNVLSLWTLLVVLVILTKSSELTPLILVHV